MLNAVIRQFSRRHNGSPGVPDARRSRHVADPLPRLPDVFEGRKLYAEHGHPSVSLLVRAMPGDPASQRHSPWYGRVGWPASVEGRTSHGAEGKNVAITSDRSAHAEQWRGNVCPLSSV